MSLLFRGTAPALVTPFTADGAIDEDAFRRLIDRQIDGGVEGLVVLGTTGENATIWPDERCRLIAVALEHTDGRVPVIIGTGNNSTSESIVFSKEAAAAGADGLLIVGPYYNKPTQAGFRAHVAAIAGATDCPLILYNVPGRTSFNCTAETTLRIVEEVPSVVGVKEASGDLAQIADILAHRPDHLAVYAGDDEVALPLMVLGADGVVSVVCNVVPDLFSELVRAGLAGEHLGGHGLAAARRAGKEHGTPAAASRLQPACAPQLGAQRAQGLFRRRGLGQILPGATGLKSLDQAGHGGLAVTILSRSL